MKKIFVVLIAALLLLPIVGCSSGQTPTETSPSPSTVASATPTDETAAVEDYYPILGNIHYVYEGEGNEYAGFDRVVDYTSDAKIQERHNNGGTELVRVIDVSDGKVTVVYAQEERYFRENELDKKDGNSQVLLMEPIKEGTAWTNDDGSVSTITAVSEPLETPSGSYSAVVVERVSEGTDTLYYFAKDIGLVKIVSKTGDYETTSTLAEIQKDASFTQLVRFYYPGASDGKQYYKKQTLSFKTNDVTKTTFEAAYTAAFEGKPGTVLPENTKINRLALGDDGIVYIDLSREFLTGMNAGSEYEQQILQSLANTFGSYYGVDKVIPTIDGALYESGHVRLKQGEYLTVDTENSLELK